MLMDEPFGALDPITRDTLATEYRRLHERMGLTTLMVTHDVFEAVLLADRVVVMRAGEVVAQVTPQELLRQSDDPGVAELMDMPRRQTERVGLGSMIAFRALARDELDVYVDYSGTLWTNVLGHTDTPRLATSCCESSASRCGGEYGVTLLGTLGFAGSARALVGAIPVEAMREANLLVDRDEGKRSPEAAARWLAERIGLPEPGG